MSSKTLRYLVAGMGGYAGSHHEALSALEHEGLARVVATCDPAPVQFADQCARWRFAERGVRVFTDYESMLAECAHDADVVVIPTPIPLHAAMHRVAVDAGLAVYLEKPPTLDPSELTAMIAVDDRARNPAVAGFNYIAEPTRLALKARLLAAEFGALKEVRTLARWPRRTGYFKRNGWAGRLLGSDGRLMLDSCLGNAMAHFVHNTLHWAGTGALFDWGQVVEVNAQLARVHAIEGPDTFLVAARTAGDVRLRLAFTHAATGASVQTETLVCERATLVYAVDSHYEIMRADGRSERQRLPAFDPLRENHLAYQRFLRGETSRPATRLIDSVPFVHLNALAYVSAGAIRNFAAERVSWTPAADPLGRHASVVGLDEAMQKFLLHESWFGPDFFNAGSGSFSMPAVATPRDLPRIGSVAVALKSSSG